MHSPQKPPKESKKRSEPLVPKNKNIIKTRSTGMSTLQRFLLRQPFTLKQFSKRNFLIWHSMRECDRTERPTQPVKPSSPIVKKSEPVANPGTPRSPQVPSSDESFIVCFVGPFFLLKSRISVGCVLLAGGCVWIVSVHENAGIARRLDDFRNLKLW